MGLMKTDWQSWAALGIVLITIGFAIGNVIRRARPKKKSSSCGHDCGCGKKWTERDFNHRPKDTSEPE